MTECDARLRVGCGGEGSGGEEGTREVGRGEWREGPGIDGSGIWSESIVVVHKRRCSFGQLAKLSPSRVMFSARVYSIVQQIIDARASSFLFHFRCQRARDGFEDGLDVNLSEQFVIHT